MSGVYYLATPLGSASISFDDGIENLVIQPEAGDLLLFPSWLPHSVGLTVFDEPVAHEATAVARVSLVLEVAGHWLDVRREPGG